MVLYHGSNVDVKEPHLIKNQRHLDFGKGFYTTSDFEQAESWAKRSVRVRGTGRAVVSCYELDDNAFEALKVLRFEEADQSWLDCVAANRKGIAGLTDYDVVIGPVANDQTFPTILLYLGGFVDADTTIRNLLTQRLKDQYTFKTEKAISLLKFAEVKLI